MEIFLKAVDIFHIEPGECRHKTVMNQYRKTVNPENTPLNLTPEIHKTVVRINISVS